MKKTSRTLNIPAIILTAALVLVTAALVVVLALFLSGNDKYKVEKGEKVVTIDGTSFYENQFRFFASLILDQENIAYRLSESSSLSQINDTLKNDTLNFAKEYIFRLREANKSGIKLTAEELDNLEQSFKQEYEENKKVGTRTLKGDEFYDYYYGLTKEQFVQFWKDWAIIEKYNAQREEMADVSLSNQERAFEEYEDYLKGWEVSVLPLSLTDCTEEEITAQKALANEVADKIRAGTEMLDLIKKYCDDEALLEQDGVVRITKASGSSYPELYEWTQEVNAGDVSVIETDSAIYVVQANRLVSFAQLKETESMKEWTRVFIVNEETAALLRSEKYAVTVNSDIYLDLDLSALIETAIKQWS